jgi:hypothetical protein
VTDTIINRPAEVAGTNPASGRSRPVRWLGIAVAIALIAATAGLAYRAIAGGSDPVAASDRSWEQAEQVRFQQLAPAADISADRAEFARMTALAPSGDASWERAEFARMSRLAPTVDTSWERAEEERMRRLAGDG